MCEHEHGHKHASRRERIRRMGRALGANVVSTAFSAVSYAINGNPVYGGEIPHSGSDAGIYGARLVAEHAGIDQGSRRFKNFLRLTMVVPAVLMLHKAWEAGVDLQSGTYLAYEPSRMDYLGAAVLTAANGVAFRQMNKIENHSAASWASRAHSLADACVSSLYGAGLAAGAAGMNAAPFAATVVGSTVGAGHLLWEARNPHAH